jgi:hypothetical protein
MTEITNIHAREILDSRGNPTIEGGGRRMFDMTDRLCKNLFGPTDHPKASSRRGPLVALDGQRAGWFVELHFLEALGLLRNFRPREIIAAFLEESMRSCVRL